MTYRFAAETEVSPEKTQADIQSLLRKAGCTDFALRLNPVFGVIAFELAGRKYRLMVPMPTDQDVRKLPNGELRQQRHVKAARDQLERTRWRSLFLLVKAQLAMVEAKAIASIEEAFIGSLVLPSGRTVYEETQEPIRLAYQGRTVPLLGGS